ncbi:MAG: hypothetical protein ABR501_04950 [Pyrinomonadaceae bacterium]
MNSLPSVLILISGVLSLATFAPAQKKKVPEIRVPQLVRTTMRHELRRLPYGGTLTLVGAPDGSISIEGWNRSEVEISAEVQLRADSEAELDQLAALNGFIIDDDANHVRVLSTGTHDKDLMRRVAKKFPKNLLGLPWKIDYRLRVPMSTDLDINAGRGPINITGIDGNIHVTAAFSETNLKLSSGTLLATIGAGKLNLNVPARSWRGVGAEIRMATGEISVELPAAFDADLNAEILRSGTIKDLYGGLQAREKPGITAQLMKARSGAGGAFLQFTVGDGTIYIKKQTP